MVVSLKSHHSKWVKLIWGIHKDNKVQRSVNEQEPSENKNLL